jgi:hypothetical protein
MKLISLKLISLALLLIAFCFFRCCHSSDPGTGDCYVNIQDEFPLLEEARQEFSDRALEAQTGVSHLLPAFTILYNDVWQIPVFGEKLSAAFLKDIHRPETLLYHAFSLLGAPAGGHGPPLVKAGNSNMLAEYRFKDDGKKSWDLLPADLQSGILDLIQAWMEAAHVMEQFIAPVHAALNLDINLNNDSIRTLLMQPWVYRQLNNFVSVDLIGKTDLRKLSFASRLMLSSVSALNNLKPQHSLEGFESLVIETEMGRVGIFGEGADKIDESFGLIVDLGGDDLYTGNIASPSQVTGPVSIIVDIAGNDIYDSGEGSLAGACLGIALLFDRSGNDRYISENAGLASSCFGTSMLYDMQGDDYYQSSAAFSQGAAYMGAGLLIDLAGDDTYYGSPNSQGYGVCLGVGVLLDLGGHDCYNHDQNTPSFVQGVGRGRWAEGTDGHSLGGGMGIFIEAGGADCYYAESFSQGASYFTGTGLFFDMEGDDQYNACSHSQAYAAHTALSGFFELKGDDRYNAGADFKRLTQILGSGRDLSVGWFIEEEGNDTYHLGNRSGGIGDLNGIGVLWDRQGEDLYIWHKNGVNAGDLSLGQTIALPEGMAMGSPLSIFPNLDHLGQFRDDQRWDLIIKQTN